MSHSQMNQNILLIEKDGTIVEKNMKPFLMDKLYSVCGYRSNKDFQKLHQWDVFELYGKKNGKKDKQNNYFFPTNEIYYGTLCIIKKNESLTLDEWNIFYISTLKQLENTNELDTDTHDNNSENTESQLETESENDIILQRHDDELKYEEYEEE
jgi:hypothetical protein